ncbi:hypothetical protein ACFU9O_29275 [Streptomyces albidoflavus]|uniref:hypothetical protein n=1 Tax=Streptomyces TaxID=1883 RepID=UPI0016450670|nr:hypothetical protein [Streptomyces sp. CBG9]
MTWLGYASGAPHAVDVTPAGIPVVGAVMALGVLAFLVWDALRAPGEPWFRWLVPAGFCLALPAVARQWLPLIAVAALLMGAGMARSNYWRWRRRRRARRPSRRAKLPPLDL